MKSTTHLTNPSFPGSEITLKLPIEDYPWWCHTLDLIIHMLNCLGWRKV